jgi:putative NIF3 family GTP cyclohydrolase 1 type 2
VPVSLRELLETVERLWPVAGAEAWDAPGLVTGDPEASVSRVLLAVDAKGIRVVPSRPVGYE